MVGDYIFADVVEVLIVPLNVLDAVFESLHGGIGMCIGVEVDRWRDECIAKDRIVRVMLPVDEEVQGRREF